MIVCLMGPSTAGKSTLAKTLQQSDPEVFARVPVDFFFVPRPASVSIADYLARPFSYDWRALDRALSANGAQRSTPDADFERLVWRSDTGGLPLAQAPVYLLDGMRPHPRCEALVMLALDESDQRQRLIERDARWGTRVAERSAHLAATYEQGCSELPREPDLRLRATDPIEHNAQRIAELCLVRHPAST